MHSLTTTARSDSNSAVSVLRQRYCYVSKHKKRLLTQFWVMCLQIWQAWGTFLQNQILFYKKKY